ncbi:MAG TPA: hypothetical protein VEO18_02420 [Thermoplasmata archaeon]|nr:hypothetical protein [Thermoplasmata archaeon]
MKSKTILLAIVLASVAIIIAAIGINFHSTRVVLPSSLPIPIGAQFSHNATLAWAVHFNVSGTRVRLVGAWTAYDGFGDPGLKVVNGTVNPPPPASYYCPALFHWGQFNGSVDTVLSAGPHTIYWNTICASAVMIVVGDTIDLVPSPFPR